MAKLKAHGKKLDQLDYAGFRLALMEDGKILRNSGDGWKRYKHVLPGNDIVAHMKLKRKRYDEKMAACPAYAEFVAGLNALGSLERQAKVKLCIEMMPDDPDGVWSSLDDYGMSTDLDEIVELCRNYTVGYEQLRTFLKGIKK